ncbi:nucleotidyl transferase AbiEii/AbiGii toxin family protein [Mycoplasma marinum]|uniref:Uncharacterized protein n=1 Tax=Mycoplasma marinum TaxID=1937190 RepID=A0A4R0XRZ6_9MOLU|nr:nucleotidyl transferase AbiEii/AbiGii toxin family protein [Mycoplasma marinum]TCG11190.1 hypothetical protein C4B24_02810 [Mycoplasma marinum]
MSKYNNLPKESVVTKASALSVQGFISFSPEKVQLEMKQGTNTSNEAYKKYKISTQNIQTLNKGVVTVEGLRMYGPERLFIQLEKCGLENTIFSEALKKLLVAINPFKVAKIYNEIKGKRRGINTERIEEYLKDNLLNLEDILVDLRRDEKANFLREYIIYLCAKTKVPFLLKGGSAVELFSNIKGSTEDIHAHSGSVDNGKILELLENKENEIYFKICESYKNVDLNSEKPVKKIMLKPFSLKHKIKDMIADIEVPISFNNTYSSTELNGIIKDFDLKARQLKMIKKTSCISFSREMLIAEKFQSIISKPENSRRTKDLIDLFLLDKEDFNKQLFRKWLFRKWEKQRNSKAKSEAIEIIKKNQTLELIKIKENFDAAKEMYGVDFSFDQCIKIYQELIKVALS